MKTLFTLVLSCTIMLSTMAQSSMIVNNSSKNHYKNEFREGFMRKTNSQQFDFKTKRKPILRSTSLTTQKLDSIIYVDWNCSTSQWENLYNWEYTYDANGNIISYIGSYWNNSTNQWEIFWKYEYTNDANGNMTSFIGSNWNNSTSQWEYSHKEEYIYDANGNMTSYIGSNWNNSTSQWENSHKEEYIYDANGNKTSYIGSNWNSTTNQWEISYKEEYTYDANSNMTSYIGSNWNSTISQWENSYKEEYNYDIEYLANDLNLPYFFSDFSVNKLTDVTGYEYDGTTWVNSIAGTLYYSDVTNSVSEVYNNAYTVYPNPVSEYVTFDISEPTINSKVDIFTIQGEKILTQRLNNNTVDVSNMPKGIYLYQLNNDNEIYNGKLIIK